MKRRSSTFSLLIYGILVFAIAFGSGLIQKLHQPLVQLGIFAQQLRVRFLPLDQFLFHGDELFAVLGFPLGSIGHMLVQFRFPLGVLLAFLRAGMDIRFSSRIRKPR